MGQMGSLREERARKMAQNMEWVQMEDLCQTTVMLDIPLEEMDQEVISDQTTIVMAGHLWTNRLVMEERAHTMLAQTEGHWGDMTRASMENQ